MRPKIPGYNESPGELSSEEAWRDAMKHTTDKELGEYIAHAKKELEDTDWNEDNRRQAEWRLQIVEEELRSRTK